MAAAGAGPSEPSDLTTPLFKESGPVPSAPAALDQDAPCTVLWASRSLPSRVFQGAVAARAMHESAARRLSMQPARGVGSLHTSMAAGRNSGDEAARCSDGPSGAANALVTLPSCDASEAPSALSVAQFPSSTSVTRKDSMARSFQRLARLAVKRGVAGPGMGMGLGVGVGVGTGPGAGTGTGTGAFSFLPETFVLPADAGAFGHACRRDPMQPWIVKPSGSSQGRGIRVEIFDRDGRPMRALDQFQPIEAGGGSQSQEARARGSDRGRSAPAAAG